MLRSFLSPLCVIALLAGCSGGIKYHPVSGVLKLDGKPLDGASVTFVPVGPPGLPAVATTDAEGRYTLETGNTKGVPAGTYKVVIIKTPLAVATDERNPTAAAKAPAKAQVPERYGNKESSGISITVPADKPGAYDLEITGK